MKMTLSMGLILLSGFSAITNVSASVIYCPKPSDFTCTKHDKVTLKDDAKKKGFTIADSPLTAEYINNGCKKARKLSLKFLGATWSPLPLSNTVCKYKAGLFYPAALVNSNYNPAPPKYKPNYWVNPKGTTLHSCGKAYGHNAVKGVIECPIKKD